MIDPARTSRLSDDTPTVQITITGEQRFGATHSVLDALAPLNVEVIDLEHHVVRDQLTIVLLVTSTTSPLEDVVKAVAAAAIPFHLRVDYAYGEGDSAMRHKGRAAVAILGNPLTADAISAVTDVVVAQGGFIDRIRRLSRWPVTTLELSLSGVEVARLRAELPSIAARTDTSIAVSQRGLGRRGKHLVVMDVDSTLVRQEAIDLIARHAGVEDAVAEITAAAMRGELNFEQSLIQRVRLLAGLDASVLDQVRHEIKLTAGARTLIRTLKRAGNQLAVVSGGFLQTVAPLAESLGIDYCEANELEIVDGKLTGNLIGPIIGREGKAAALRRFAAQEGLPSSRTVAIGDGANDIDMLRAAGLGIAFNAKPALQELADTSVNVPYLDSVLYLLGMSREEIEEADQSEVNSLRG